MGLNDMNLDFQPVTGDNWRQVTRLRLRPEQERFVAPNWYTLLQGIFEGHTTYAVYDEGTLIGLTMIGLCDFAEDGLNLKGHEIIRLMIDVEHQNKGYGRAILERMIAEIRTDPTCETIIIMFDPDNDVARHLYTSVGFSDTGHIVDDEVVFTMKA